MTLTRRDRAALVLAYECLRRVRTGKRSARVHARHVLDAAGRVLMQGHDGSWENSAAFDVADDAIDAERAGHDPRLLRARLALLLRAVLRADRGDYGACEDDCHGCRWSHVSDNFAHDAPRRYVPLWEQAKP